MKVHVVVVTFNRLPYLKQLLQSLSQQTTPVEKIFVVNNSSSDGTQEWLDTQTNLTAILQPNTGGAGGFSTGVSKAIKHGAEWIWLMDDDVLPADDCLEKLLSHSEVSQCLHPIHLLPGGEVQDEEIWFDSTACQRTNLFNRSMKGGKQIWFRNTGSFEGMLIARQIVDKIGLPDTRFFLAHDDLAYGYLASRFTNVSVVADARMQKQSVQRKPDSSLVFDYYYMMRNLWLLQEYAEKEMPGFEQYRKRRILSQFLYTFYKIFFVDKPAKKRRACKLLWLAFRDYRQKKGGPFQYAR